DNLTSRTPLASMDNDNVPNQGPAQDPMLLQLMSQLQAQQQMIEQLHSQQLDTSITTQDSALPHRLPTRPHYNWTPPEELLRQLPDLQADLFTNVLDEDVKRSLIDSYPPMQQA
ncbi:hypothetical protein EC973_005428, partial [Apophysomyces ossiformis]